MRTVKGTTTAWIASMDLDPRTLINGDDAKVISELWYCTHDMVPQGWVRVGRAEITVTIDGYDAIINSKIETLRAEKTLIIATAEAKSNRIEGMIQQLLAIEYKP